VSTVHPDNPWDGIVVNIFDITERRQLEEQVLFAQKMDAIDTLSSGIAHDFNNIMSTVLGYASFLSTEVENNEKLIKGLKAIEKAAIRASELTSQLLAYSRKEILAIKPVDLNRVMLETFDLISKTFDKSIKTQAIQADSSLVVQGDESQLAQVIMNLALNAQSAMPEGGTLTIETSLKNITDGFPSVDFHIEPGKYVRLKISDTGIGMDRETMKRMYEPYFSKKTESGGTGLGLSVVYGIVKGHNGYIYAESEQNRGTDFFVLLPASDHKEVRKSERDVPVVGGDETILVVDDEQDILVMLKDVMEKHGYSVYVAQSGIKGLVIYTRHRKKIDLIILDIKMPEMDGRMFLERLIENNIPAKVLLMSGYSERESYESLLDMGASDFIAKPFHNEGLLKKIREVLD
jgi:nitrogen-specific signal transduction histidine kinase